MAIYFAKEFRVTYAVGFFVYLDVSNKFYALLSISLSA